jgi:hypothetical protein
MMDGIETPRYEAGNNAPPALEEVLGLPGRAVDDCYDILGLLFGGIRGAWHRLWGGLLLTYTLGADAATDNFVAEVRTEVEEYLGRPMTDAEWAALDSRARSHAECVVKPLKSKEEEAANPNPTKGL